MRGGRNLEMSSDIPDVSSYFVNNQKKKLFDPELITVWMKKSHIK